MLVFPGQVAGRFTRMLLNILFPIGGTLVLIGIDNLFGNLFLNAFITALIVFWIIEGTMFSSWNHWKTCSGCKSRCAAEN